MSDLIYEFIERCRSDIFSRFLSGKKDRDAHRFTELLLTWLDVYLENSRLFTFIINTFLILASRRYYSSNI